ncbi:MAG TPA: recombinase RecT, partial [Candidatus Saccharimonadales bacterium]|nr:recombinase RecT [Candidatus Saccharimonadales bacterium]
MEVQKFIKNPSIQKTIEDRLKSRAGQFTTTLLSVINSNNLIAECRPETVLNAAMTAASMDLPINQNLGFAYIIPYKNKGVYEAQFQLGARGFKQLAQRTGKYKYINDSDVREGEIKRRDRLSGAIEFEWNDDDVKRGKAKIIGYVSYFELLNGFSSTVYMSMEDITAHGKRYSQSFKSGFGPWKDNFEAMALKTVTKLNISKNGPLSTEMENAITADQSVDDGKERKYIDNDE